MAQLVNHLQNNIFVNPLPLLLLSGALHLAEPGLTAGRLAGRQTKINTDEFQNFRSWL